MLADSKTSDLSTFESVSAFRRSTKVVRNVVLHCREVLVEFVVETSLDCFGYFDLRLRSSIMGEPLSPDRVFDFPMDELEPHPTYDFFAPGPLPGYVGNPNNNNGWIEADVPLLGELGAEVDESMIDPVINEVAEPIAEGEEQVIALVIDVEEDIAMLFGDNDFSDDDLEGFEGEEEVWEVNEE
ncbi:hypothetical protein Tco_0296794 [Tanacetum coccineum]